VWIARSGIVATMTRDGRRAHPRLPAAPQAARSAEFSARRQRSASVGAARNGAAGLSGAEVVDLEVTSATVS
jgi:hypothetical protein